MNETADHRDTEGTGDGKGNSTDVLPVGKLDMPFLARLLGDIAASDPSVVVGPGIGRDVAVLDAGGECHLLAKSDPVTFATDAIGYYAVAVNANDIATAGGVPRWFLATVLLPEGRTDEAMVEGIFRQIRAACEDSGITLVGGHTEVTLGLERPIISGHMLGLVPHGKAITSAGARPGDAVLLTKGIAVEGTAIIARERQGDLLAAGFEEDWLQAAQRLLFAPGISVLPEARAVVAAVNVHAMHDPTEGGIATGLWEMAVASGVAISVALGNVPILSECRRLCTHFGIEPLGLIASGSLLIAVAEGDAAEAIAACERAGVTCARIGTICEGAPSVYAQETGEQLPRYDQDEVTRVL
jgi:hydrogenase maturation factor